MVDMCRECFNSFYGKCRFSELPEMYQGKCVGYVERNLDQHAIFSNGDLLQVVCARVDCVRNLKVNNLTFCSRRKTVEIDKNGHCINYTVSSSLPGSSSSVSSSLPIVESVAAIVEEPKIRIPILVEVEEKEEEENVNNVNSNVQPVLDSFSNNSSTNTDVKNGKGRFWRKNETKNNNEPVITEEVVSEVPEVVVSDHFCVSCKFFNGSECVTVSLGLQNTANNCKYWKNKKETV